MALSDLPTRLDDWILDSVYQPILDRLGSWLPEPVKLGEHLLAFAGIFCTFACLFSFIQDNLIGTVFNVWFLLMLALGFLGVKQINQMDRPRLGFMSPWRPILFTARFFSLCLLPLNGLMLWLEIRHRDLGAFFNSIAFLTYVQALFVLSCRSGGHLQRNRKSVNLWGTAPKGQ